MKTTPLLLAIPFLFQNAMALTPVSDNFNARLLNATRWTSESGAGGKLTQSSGRVNYTTLRASDDDYAVLTLRNNRPGYNENWQVILDVANSAGKGEEVGVGMMIANGADPLDNVNLEFYGTGPRGGFNFIGITDDFDDISQDITARPNVTKGSMKISFNKNTKLFTFWYDRTGSADGFKWERLCTFSPTGKGGDRRGNWKMNPAGGNFTVAVFGYSEDQVVANGKASFDNFVLKAGN
ncbi:MAG: hypothetical protein MUF13_00985 [Akkermansiaceae bacterium]|jgi:hypothetical protein|nr:hypothetical protein [Akkermansiaceae bacterium]